MPSRKQEKQIRDVMTLRQLAMSAILAESARDMSILTANEALSKLQRDRYAVATAEGVTEKIYQNYVKDLNRGGTSCIERVVKDIGDGKVRVTTSVARWDGSACSEFSANLFCVKTVSITFCAVTVTATSCLVDALPSWLTT